MHPNDLIQFRDNIATPRMMRLFEETQIPDGACYIDNLEIKLLDGRNCGFDNHIHASGLVYRNGVAEEYLYDECDVDLNDFFTAHKDCIFISDGHLRIGDELEELDLRTRLRKIGDCERFFSWFETPKTIIIEMFSVQYEKLKYLKANQLANEKKPALNALVESASSRSAAAHTLEKAPKKETLPNR